MTNPFSLENKKILVTGASSGIGRAIAILISQMGGEVILSGRDEGRLNETKSQMIGINHQIIISNLSEEEDLERMLLEIKDPIDGFVHSAGIVKTAPVKFIKKEDFRNILNVNLETPIYIIQKLIKLKKISKGSSIVFISSISGNCIGMKGNVMYSASKGALNGILNSIALELAGQKIRINSVCPGMVRTPMNQENLTISEEQLELDEKLYPLGYGDPEDVAGGVVYLLAPASKWMTGQTIVLDGGYTSQ